MPENVAVPQLVAGMMGLLRRFIRHDLAELHGNGVKVRVIGERVRLVRLQHQ